MLALLVVGSATLLFSCSSKPAPVEYDLETLMTERSENREITMTENGARSYTFAAPLIEGYSLAQNPYQEFDKGIKMTTYTSDSLSLVDATITAEYAIYYDKQKLWEAKGNVVIIKNNRKGEDTTVVSHTEVYTQQLFWDARTKKIYSNVDTKVLQPDGWHQGVGFEADEDLKNIHFRKYKSEMEFDFTPVEEQPETKEEPKKEFKPGPKPRPDEPPKRGGRPEPRKPSDTKTFNPSASPSSKSQTPTGPSPASRVKEGNSKISSAIGADMDRPMPGKQQRPNNQSIKGDVKGGDKAMTSPARVSSPQSKGVEPKAGEKRSSKVEVKK